MYYDASTKLMYLAHPRTASMATAAMLCNRLGFTKVIPGDHHSQLWEKSPANPVTKENRSEWTVFTAIRNHWDAAVSWRFKRTTHRKDNTPWGADAWRALFESNRWVTDDRMYWLHADEADVILRYESIEIGLRALLSGRGLVLVALQKDNVTPSRDGREYRQFFLDDGRQYIYDRFGQEIERFGYAF